MYNKIVIASETREKFRSVSGEILNECSEAIPCSTPKLTIIVTPSMIASLVNSLAMTNQIKV